ncbi:hypothetical protein KY327_02950, partial [Candidatus Woesearchaeota archaeon]|nr:hypothetical protein [Candidatus Woesearchaeota archaeon]
WGNAELRGVFDGNGFAGSADGLLSFLGLENVGDHIDITSTGDNWQFNFGWNMFQNTGALNHGRMLVILLSQLNFHRYNGYPFSGGVDLDANPSGVLRGDNYYHPGGDYGFQNFQAHVVSWPQGLDRYDATWQVDACYAYSTYAAPSICVDPAPYDDRDKVCHPREYTWSGSQGAPVAITSLKQDSTPRKMILTFTIRNVGQGEVFHPGYMERCSPYYPGRFDARYKDIVYIGDIRIGGGTPDNPSGRLTCTPGYKVRLRDGVGTFTCEYNLQYAGSRNAYETPVVVELWYGYHETIKTHTLIKRAG